MILGRMQSARAIATRCCWPPESWPGYFSACSGMRTRLSRFIATSSASFLGIFFTQIGASVRFSRMVRCGKRLNDWNTMPTSRRMASMFLTSLESVTPSTTMVPAWCSSSRLMQRMRVDLPEPDGPQITIFSPSLTSRLMSVSTWNWPNHLLTPVRVITDGAPLRSRAAALVAMNLISLRALAARSLVELELEILAVARHREAEAEIDEGGEDGDLAREARPVGIDQRLVGGVEEVEDADDQHQRGVLEEADEGVDQRRDHHPQRLRQDDERGLLHVAQPERVGRLELSLGQRLQAAPDDLGDIGAGEQDDGDLGAQELVDGHAARQEQGQHDRGHDQEADQRHAADQLDEAHAQALDQRQVGAPTQCQQDAVGEGEQKAVGGKDHRHRQAAPQAGLDVAERRDRQLPVRQDADDAQHQTDDPDGGGCAVG